jgi:hypothetical protein
LCTLCKETRLAKKHGPLRPQHQRRRQVLRPHKSANSKLLSDGTKCKCRLTSRSSGSSNGVPPGPEVRYGVHFLSSGPGVTPLLSPLAPTLGKPKFPIHMQPAVSATTSQGVPALRGGEFCLGCAGANTPWALRLVLLCTCRAGSFVSQRPALSPREIAAWRGRWQQSSAVVRQEFQGKQGRRANRRAASGIRSNRARTPNPPLKRSANGVPHWPSSARPAAHFALAAQRVTPLAPA